MPALETSWYATSEHNNVLLMEKFVKSGGVEALLSAFKEDFIEDADPVTRRNACLWILRILKIALCAVGFGCMRALQFMSGDNSDLLSDEMKEALRPAGNVMENLQTAIGYAGPTPTSDAFVQHVGKKVGDELTPEQVSNWCYLWGLYSFLR